MHSKKYFSKPASGTDGTNVRTGLNSNYFMYNVCYYRDYPGKTSVVPTYKFTTSNAL